jgi:hypothetical protein
MNPITMKIGIGVGAIIALGGASYATFAKVKSIMDDYKTTVRTSLEQEFEVKEKDLALKSAEKTLEIINETAKSNQLALAELEQQLAERKIREDKLDVIIRDTASTESTVVSATTEVTFIQLAAEWDRMYGEQA